MFKSFHRQRFQLPPQAQRAMVLISTVVEVVTAMRGSNVFARGSPRLSPAGSRQTWTCGTASLPATASNCESISGASSRSRATSGPNRNQHCGTCFVLHCSSIFCFDNTGIVNLFILYVFQQEISETDIQFTVAVAAFCRISLSRA